MGREVALPLSWVFAPDPFALAIAVLVDFVAGDPEYRFHPVRLIGRSLTAVEQALRRVGLDGYAGGVVLCLVLAAFWTTAVCGFVGTASWFGGWVGMAAHAFILYSFLALGDLLRHGRDIEHAVARSALSDARRAVSKLVGRDTAPMDGPACRRAAVESLAENLADGFISPLFWYVVGGVPLLTLFKLVSTMDSMVGYKTPAYLRFGWCGARLDDLMNFVPARVTWLIVSGVAALLPGYSGVRAFRVGLDQHALLPGPNAGWPEAAVAGAMCRRLVGPIWLNGQLVTDVWLGHATDPPLTTADDYADASRLVAVSGCVAAAMAVALAWIVSG
jgi:adenosylcobinamide-phosphate synthase